MNAKAEVKSIVLAYDGSQGSQRALEWVVTLLGAKVTAVTVVKPPEYSPTIDEVDEFYDLIVTGTRGMGGFKNLIIGSVAQKVVTYSKVPVLVIK